MAEQSAIGIFDSLADAEHAIEKLEKGGFPIRQVSIVARNLESEKRVHGFVTAGDVAKSGASTGGWLGGLFGVLVGAAFIWVPGVGPLIVAGPLAAVILGAIEGAAAGAAGGGLLGGLIGWGVSKQHILKYEEVMRGGKYLLVAHGSAAEVEQARGILAGAGASELAVHAEG